ncbi:MAG: ATP-binding cassette domain-containing protein [Erysipelotrichaceae bacterium]|nr:ATP-binding cassette domain-containing protein [Erysipelotrichaceae bacterium]
MYLEVKNLIKNYGEKENYTRVLNGISFELEEGKMCVIQGSSGSGKSTLLNCIEELDKVDGGSVVVDGINIRKPTWCYLAQSLYSIFLAI